MIVVADQDTGRLVWAGEGRSDAELNRFFDELGNAAASWIDDPDLIGGRTGIVWV